MKFTRILRLLSLLLIASACRSANDQQSRTVLTGNWRTACLIDSGGATSSRVSYAFTDDHSVRRHKELFADASCGSAAGTLEQVGTFALEVREGDADYDIDLFFTAIAATPASAATAAQWNAAGFCGISAWVDAVATSVLGATDPACESYGVKRVEYRDVVEVTANVSLVFASTLEAQRPRPDRIESRPVDQIFLRATP